MTTSEPVSAAIAVGPLTRSMLQRNLSVVAVSYVVGSLAGFATQSVMGHVLGSRTYGVYVTGLALATTLSVVQEVAGPAWLVRVAAQSTGRYRDLADAVLSFRALAGVAVVCLSLVVGVALGIAGGGLVVVAVIAVVTGLNAVLRALRVGLQAAERMPTAAALATANSLSTAVVMSALVLSGAGLVAAVVGSALVSAALVPVAWWQIDARLRPRLSARLRPLRAAATESLGFTVVAILWIVLGYADTLVIRVMLGTHATGLYGAAWRLLTVILWVPSIVLDSVMRAMSAMAVVDRSRFRDLVDRSAAGLLLVGLPLAVAGSFVARPVFVFVFGGDFGDGADAFRILLWSVPLSYPAWVVTEAVLVSGRPATLGWLLAVVVPANVVANILVAPHFGIEGSAWVMLATEVTVLLAAVVFMHRQGLPPRWPVALAPAVVLAAVTAAVVAPLSSKPLAAPLVAGTATYLAGVVLLWRLLRSPRFATPLLGVSEALDR